jgi:hypothetical protein
MYFSGHFQDITGQFSCQIISTMIWLRFDSNIWTNRPKTICTPRVRIAYGSSPTIVTRVGDRLGTTRDQIVMTLSDVDWSRPTLKILSSGKKNHSVRHRQERIQRIMQRQNWRHQQSPPEECHLLWHKQYAEISRTYQNSRSSNENL